MIGLPRELMLSILPSKFISQKKNKFFQPRSAITLMIIAIVAFMAFPSNADCQESDVLFLNNDANYRNNSSINALNDVIPTCKVQSGALLLDFEGIENMASVGNTYSACGAIFSDDSLAIIDGDAGGDGNFANEPSPNTVLFFLDSDRATLNFPDGIVQGFSFYYTAINETGFIKVYSEIDRQGTVLATLNLDITPQLGQGDPNGSYDNWKKIGVSFDGIAKSIDFGGTANRIGFDNITLNSPEAAETKIEGFHFEPITNQVVSLPFKITIIAIDQYGNKLTAFNESISLIPSSFVGITIHDEKGVKFENGEWSGNITIKEPSNDMALIATYQSIHGESNFFAVTGYDPSSNLITGKIFFNEEVSDFATVRLYPTSVSGPPVFTTISNMTGEYSFENVPPGQYKIQANKEDFISNKTSIIVRNGCTYTQDLKIRSKKQPLLIVPGILGSTYKKSIAYYPKLPWEVGMAPMMEMKVLNPIIPIRPGISIKPVDLERFKGNFKEDFEVIEAIYDWRLDCDKASTDYLKRVIDDAKETSGHDKVNIVAHSMGGLVTRAYIQSNNFENDINKFVMLGTPNKGSANMYMIVEGGEPKRVDDLLGNSFFNVYYESVKNQYEYFNVGDFDKAPQSTVINFIEQNCKSARQLLPTYSFLRVKGNEEELEILLKYKNAYLINLNDEKNVNIKRMTSSLEEPTSCDNDCVETRLYLSNNKKTIREINVEQRTESGIYPDGEPCRGNELVMGDDNGDGNGDGTVLADKASEPFNFDEEIVKIDSYGKHVGLFKNDSIIELVYEFLTEKNFTASTKSLNTPMSNETPTRIIEMLIKGSVQPYLLNPGGKTQGVNPYNNQVEENILSANLGLSPNLSIINIEDPTNGKYTVQLNGPVHSMFTIQVHYGLNEPGKLHEQKAGGFYTGKSIDFNFTIDDSASEPIKITDPVGEPINISASKSSGFVKLSWSPSTNGEVVGYNIYSRIEGQPQYQLLDNTSGNSYQTIHEWKIDDNQDLRYYVITSYDQAGKESFFYSVLKNKLDTVALFSANKTTGPKPLSVTFINESKGNIESYDWDCDNDGETESTSQNFSHTYTEEGNYSVTLTVSGPEGTDKRVKTNYITVTSQDENVGGDDDGDGGGGGGGCFIETLRN